MSVRIGLSLLLLTGCGGKTSPVDTGPFPTGPVIEHTALEEAVREGEAISFSAKATDSDGVDSVRLFYRNLDASAWSWEEMTGEGDTYTAELSDEDVLGPGVEYYIRATDLGEPQAASYAPDVAPNEGYSFQVLVDAHPLPFTADFEVDEKTNTLRELGWLSYSQAFAYPGWDLEADGGVDDSASVWHSMGNGDIHDWMEDWLLSPALDLSEVERVQVSWYQTGNDVTSGVHTLYVSEGSPDPSEGDFVWAADLGAATEDEWARSEVVDLSEWAGSDLVYLAWVYEGANADAWGIDDVTVQALTADLSATLGWSPDPVWPGETATLTFSIENAIDEAATAVVGTLVVDESYGTLDTDTVDVGDIDSLGTGTAEFSFTVDDAVPENSYIPATLELSDGTTLWTQDAVLTVGYPSTATVMMTIDTSSAVEVIIGVGDVDDPDWSVTALSEVVKGELEVAADITDAYAFLPPAAGENRWWASIGSSDSGSVSGFEIDFGETTYSATEVGDLSAEERLIVYLPEPPDPIYSSHSTSPSTLEPGDTGVSFSTITFKNDGAGTSGGVTATLTSEDPNVTITDAGPVTLSSGTWSAGTSKSLTSAFSFDVSSDAIDSLPLDFSLVLTDDAESWTVDFEVEVPWPVLRVSAVEVDDSAEGNGDGLLDPDESATLTIELTNIGGLDSDGQVEGTLSVASTSTATATILTGEENFGSMDAGDSRDEDFELQVLTGSEGDVLLLEFALTDNSASYTTQVEVPLGEPIWQAFTPEGDATNDNIDDYSFDFLNGTFRVLDGTMQMRFESAEAYDASTLFIESWGSSSGSDYSLYRLVVQGYSSTLQGYDSSGFNVIDNPTVSQVSETVMQLDWDISTMALIQDELSMGFAAGWCGAPEYYCDHFPDGWGYPYEGYYSSYWLDLEW